MKPHNHYRFAVAAPIFPVTDMELSVQYFTEKLLFTVAFQWSESDGGPIDYTILQQGDTEIHLTKTAEPTKTAAYFFLEHIAPYYEAVQQTGANIRNVLADQPWEMREFDVTDPDGNVMVFGEHLSRISFEGTP